MRNTTPACKGQTEARLNEELSVLLEASYQGMEENAEGQSACVMAG